MKPSYFYSQLTGLVEHKLPGNFYKNVNFFSTFIPLILTVGQLVVFELLCEYWPIIN